MSWRWKAGLALVAALAVAAGGYATLPQAAADGKVTRTYYVAADEVAWDYAPTGSNQITGEPFGDQENTFVQNGSNRIGHVYKKAQFREYTDGTFTTLKARPAEWQHLGLLGPVLRGAVGDTIKVVFRNDTSLNLSVHPHGVFYAKDSEGAPYNDGTSGGDKADDAVPPGGLHTYVWEIPTRAGPGPMDGSSILWMYHSHTDEVADTYSGLIGPIIVTAAGKARADGSPNDVDRELVTLFSVMDENQSAYIDQNIAAYAGKPSTVNKDDDEFVESNLMHSINGYVYGNLPLSTLTMKKGERVRWYVMDLGTEVDLHTPHWHGNTVLVNGMRTDNASLLPGSMIVADMVPDDVGTWLLHCHVNDHILAGMNARYRVTN